MESEKLPFDALRRRKSELLSCPSTHPLTWTHPGRQLQVFIRQGSLRAIRLRLTNAISENGLP